MEDWTFGPPLLVGDLAVYNAGNRLVLGKVRWIGKLQQKFGQQMAVGLILEEPVECVDSSDGKFGTRQLFQCPDKQGVLTEVSNVRKISRSSLRQGIDIQPVSVSGHSSPSPSTPTSVKSNDLTCSDEKQQNAAKVNSNLRLNMYVEDRTSHYGPVCLDVPLLCTVKELKTIVEDRFKFPQIRQKWIVGKTLLDKDDMLLHNQPFNKRKEIFLFISSEEPKSAKDNEQKEAEGDAKEKEDKKTEYVKGRYWNYETNRWSVCSESEDDENDAQKTNETKVKQAKEAVKKEPSKEQNLKKYQQLDDLDLIPNAENFQCPICWIDYEPGEGVVLRECLHTFCNECLKGTIEHSYDPNVKCPYKDDNYSCDMNILDREIRALLTHEMYEKHQMKSLKQAEGSSQNTFHCKTPDCAGFCFITEESNTFKCDLCKKTNCITCQAIHSGMDCKEYQRNALNDEDDEDVKKTKEWIQGLLKTNDALYCPNCEVLLLKKWGCDWVRCSYCKTEICWVTKQLRWGPGGKGDTSGGCKCMADGRTKCHPKCNYCH